MSSTAETCAFLRFLAKSERFMIKYAVYWDSVESGSEGFVRLSGFAHISCCDPTSVFLVSFFFKKVSSLYFPLVTSLGNLLLKLTFFLCLLSLPSITMSH